MKGMKIIVKNRKLLVFIVLLISSAVSKGQIYKYIGLEDGLNNQKICPLLTALLMRRTINTKSFLFFTIIFIPFTKHSKIHLQKYENII